MFSSKNLLAEKHRLAIKQDHNVKGIVLKKGHGQKRRQVVIAQNAILHHIYYYSSFVCLRLVSTEQEEE